MKEHGNLSEHIKEILKEDSKIKAKEVKLEDLFKIDMEKVNRNYYNPKNQ